MRTAKENDFALNPSARHWLSLTTPQSLAAFRILFGICIGVDALLLLRDAPLWFSGEVGIFQDGALLRALLGIWLAATVGITLGWKTRIAALVNYACVVVFLGLAAMPHGYEYHNDTVYLMLSFGLLFLPVSNCWALDARNPKPKKWMAPNKLAGVFLALVASAVYFDSAVWKLSSQMWIEGLGYWSPATRPFDVFWPIAWTRETEWIARTIGYTTLAFELLFPILIWLREVRVPLLLTGFAFHVGIGLVLPLPLFGLLMCALLLALWPIGKEPQDAAQDRIRPAQRAIIAGYFTLWAVTFCFGLVDPVRLLVQNGVGGVQHTIAPSWLANTDQPIIRRINAGMTWSYRLFGFRSHPIFLDNQFTLATTQTRLVYVPEHPDPNRTGTDAEELRKDTTVLTSPLRNRRSISWSYRMAWPPLPQATIKANMLRYARFSIEHKGINLTTGIIAVEQRAIHIPTDRWVRGQLEKNLQSPWEVVGRLRRVQKRLVIEWTEPMW